MSKRALWVGVLVVCAAGPARAQELFERTRDLFNERQYSLQAGGGFTNFSETGTQLLTNPGGSWSVRGAFGLDRRVGAEAAYVGTAMTLDIPAADDAAVIGTAFEALVRLGYPIELIRNVSFVSPYVAAGVGWSLFNLAGTDESDEMGLEDSDSTFTIPLGIGVGLGYERLSLDVRFMWRPAFGDEMFRDANQTSETVGQNTLGTTFSLGYTF
jgi:hypothetical protein